MNAHASQQMRQFAFGVGVALNVTLRRLHAGAPGQLLRIAHAAANLRHLPRRPRDQGVADPSAMNIPSC